MVVVLCMGALMVVSLENYYRGYLVHNGNKADVLLGTLERKKYNDVMMHMIETFQEGDFIAAVGLQSYMITHSYVAKYFKNYNYVPFKTFCLFSSAETLRPYEKKFLAISELAEEIPSDKLNDLYGFALQSNGKMGMTEIDLANDRYKRIWVVTSNWINFPPQEMIYQEVYDHLSNYFKPISSVERDGVRVELHARNKINPLD